MVGVQYTQNTKPGIDEEYDGDICPECGKVHIPNAVTIAAMKETEDIIAGKTPAEWYHSIEEFFEDLHK